MPGPLIYVDTSDVRDGALAELKDAIGELAGHVERTQQQMVVYRAFFSADGDRMTVVHVHRDAASLDRFVTLAGARFGRFSDLLTLRSIDVYGEPTDHALRALEDKARLLGADGVAVHMPHTGFSRIGHD